jgi:hypothetical protein
MTTHYNYDKVYIKNLIIEKELRKNGKTDCQPLDLAG